MFFLRPLMVYVCTHVPDSWLEIGIGLLSWSRGKLLLHAHYPRQKEP